MSMPLDQLEAMVLGKAQALGQAQAAPPQAPPAPMEPAAPGGVGLDLSMVSPDLVMQATTKLNQLGLAIAPSQTVTPELLEALQAALDTTSPGLYNIVGNPDDLEEVLNGIATGELLSDFAGGAGAAPGPGVPGAAPGAPGPAAPSGGAPGGLF